MNLFGFFRKEPLEPLIDLPTSVDDLNDFVSDIINSDPRIPNTEDTYDNIATMLMHLNQNVAKAPLSYFVNGVLKSLANKAAFTKLAEFRDNRAKKVEEEKTKAELTLVKTEATQPGIQASVESVQNS